MLRSFIGTKSFYKRVLSLMLPIMVQNGITNLVNMLDNVMVGQVGTVEMTGVAVANQLIFVFNLCVFGAVSGAGIFGAQFFGSGDHRGLRDTFRFKLVFCTGLTVCGVALLVLCGEPLVQMYLRGDGEVTDAAASLRYALDYLWIILIGLLPAALVQCYASTLRETGQTLVPMYAGLAAVLVNLGLNYVLIFGRFGAPVLGVQGAAIATVISRFVELAVVVLWTHRHTEKNPFIVGALRSLHVPGALIRQIVLKGLPLMLNETLWAFGIALANQRYSLRGLDVVAANNISQTFFNVFSVAFMAVGAAIGIILGQMLGAGETDGARDAARKLIAFSVFTGAVIGAVYFICAQWIPDIYNTTEEVRLLATRLMQITALLMPVDAFAHASYFTLRSGGKIWITILFDSCFVWAVTVTSSTLLTQYTALPILPLYAICQGLNIIKCVLGYIFVRQGSWAHKIVSAEPEEDAAAGSGEN